MGVELAAAPSAQKLRGGYYTPAPLADWLAHWVAAASPQTIFEPSCGDGALLAAAARRAPNARLLGVEIDPAEAMAAGRQVGNRGSVHEGDLFSWLADQWDGALFDAVIGNPPFIRYQNFPEAYRDRAMAFMRERGLNPNRLTNAWVPFVVAATSLLRPGGRLALVLPAEVMQVSYAAELRGYLARSYRHLTLVTFEKLVFSGIQQETVLLLGERSGRDEDSLAGIATVHVATAADLPGADATLAEARVDGDHLRDKWTRYLLAPADVEFLSEVEAHPALSPVSAYAEVDVGLVTGRNEFFVLAPSEANRMGLEGHCTRMIGRSAQIPGLRLTEQDWLALHEADSKCLLLDLPSVSADDLPPSARAYVQEAEARGVHTGYKCRIRLPHWWKLPSAWSPDAFMLRQIHDGPRLVVNEAEATCTDTLHRVSVRDGVSVPALTASFCNSLTWAFAEVLGRSYGGGVLELEPTEAEHLPLPPLSIDLDLAQLEEVRRAKGSLGVLDEVDAAVLPSLGLTLEDRARLRRIWEQLSGRRGARK